MINVLPQEEKKALDKEYRIRLITIWFFLIAILGVFATFLLLPPYVYSQGKIDLLEGQLAAFNESHPELSENDLTAIIGEINSTLHLLDNGKVKVPVSSGVLQPILSLRPKGITFEQIFYTERTTGEQVIEIHGRATLRSVLQSFKDGLEADTRIKSVNLPISNFVKPSNIEFSVTIEMKK